MSTKPATKKLFSVPEFAGLVGCSDRLIHKMCKQGRLGTQVSGVWVLTHDDFSKYENRGDRRFSENSGNPVKND